ncbi:solute carrier family 40 (iron-regulated transporter), member 1 [Geosmithia morbida]|uniref:Solute carrier family 40 member n=1 Tax=Geosmithia morbida TaxID=1094350 RepID=A0A9P5D8F2_9HYPO|nr:solute carrier family 40 (iron-regulated transporter), member 1 [Geosmithia morbida]KAF4126725.1 solute carrier family 40 (iron-regulated transporter), member 1 [Geosmithia morbida]
MRTSEEETSPLLVRSQSGSDSGPGEEQHVRQQEGQEQQDGGEREDWSIEKKARRLYVSHFLSTSNSRVFEFGSVLYLAAVFPNTLLPLSLYAVARGLAAMFLSSTVGRYIDTGHRLAVVRLSIVLQRVAVAASCLIFLVLVCGAVTSDLARSWSFVGLVLLSCVEKLGSIMSLVSVERDWKGPKIVTIAEGHREALPVMNAQMRRIDLVCKLVGPFAIGIIDGFSTELAVAINLGMNLLSIPVEYIFIAQGRGDGPHPPAHARGPEEEQQTDTGQWLVTAGSELVRNTRLYFHHPAFLPSFSGAIMYFTVLSFSGRMVTYLMAEGYTSTQVSVARTLSVCVEVMATWLGPWLMGRIGPVRAGLWFSSWLAVSLAVAVSLFLLLDEYDGGGGDALPPSSLALVVGAILSRPGLWGFDLCSQLLIQDAVEESDRGAFSMTEAGWQNTFELMSHVSTMIWSDPEQFGIPATASAAAIIGAWILYSRFVLQQRGHLLHRPACISGSEKWWRRRHQHEQEGVVRPILP